MVKEMNRKMDYVIPPACDGKKLIVFLRGVLKMSARTVTKLKNDPEGLLLNGEHVRTIDPVHTGDALQIRLPSEENAIAPSDFSALKIIYEDEDLMVINKPACLAMHPTHNHQGDTLANMVAGYLQSQGKTAVFRAVGRLDKQTSGLVLIALNRHVSHCLQGNYEKTYFAVAEGEIRGSGTIDRPICRPDPHKTLRAVGETGERAVTHYEAIRTDGAHSFLKITLETGRTHQIRVHFSSLGHPLAGDDMYGGHTLLISRAALHCGELRFIHPITGEALFFTAPLPEDFLFMQK